MNIKELDKKANAIREDIIEMLTEAKSGHSAGSLGMVDVFTALYFGDVMKLSMASLKGKASGDRVSKIVKELL